MRRVVGAARRTKYEALDRPLYGWLAGEERSPEVPKLSLIHI